jgi:hypothetical protein
MKYTNRKCPTDKFSHVIEQVGWQLAEILDKIPRTEGPLEPPCDLKG